MLPSSPSFPSRSFQIIVNPPPEDHEAEYLVFDAGDLPEPESPRPAFNRTDVPTVVMPRRNETVRDDSEIVEIVKQPNPKSLRSRASRAFRSIKNVARSSSRNNKPYAQDMFASSQSTQATFATAPPPVTPPLARRGSIILSQLFRTPPPAEVLPPSSTLEFLAGEADSDDDEDDNDDDDDRPRIMPPRGASPSPSVRTFSSTVRRRLSILNFQRKARPAPPPSRPSSPPTLSRGSTVPSTSSSVPQTPTDESYPPPPPSKDDDDPDRTIGEMRLDSLHFESLSFDADNF
ncbi:hypothetical protein B0H11DRAFT_2011090 [Mycena galericulata]|nr:hypothetical protein B0H11DRAFT_2011090 [Mycena galericulata]